MSALLDVRDLSVDFPLRAGLLASLLPGPGFLLDVIKDASFSLEPGETLGLVGESGSGKTTLARALLGLIPTSGGTVRFRGETLADAKDFAAIRRHAAMMFQDPVAAFSPRMSIGAALTEPFVIHGEPMGDRRAKAEELLDMVGLSRSFASRFPHEMSGGQARRASVARALALKPALVIADEPTAGLDVSVQGEILNLMTGLKASHNLSYLVITHNLSMVRHVSDRIAVMYLGRMVETGPTRAVFSTPLHPYSKSLIAAEPKPDPRARRADLAIQGEIPSLLNRPTGCVFHTRCPLATALCKESAPALRAVDDTRSVRCHHV